MPNPRRRRAIAKGGYPNIAAQFASASSQYATVADNAALSMGAGVKMGVAGWVNFTSLGTSRALVSKGDYAAANSTEYGVLYSTFTNTFSLRLSTGAVLTTLNATTFGVASTATWYFIAAWTDGTNANISVNNGPVDQIAFSADIVDGTNPFRLGATSVPGLFMDGLMDSFGIWKRALTAAELTQLYRGGVGFAYRDLSTALKVALVAWYNLDGDLNDSIGGNHATNTNGVTFAAGKR
jgi:hypothetical protein